MKYILSFFLIVFMYSCVSSKKFFIRSEAIKYIDITFYNVDKKLRVGNKDTIKDLVDNYLNGSKKIKSKFAPIYRFDFYLDSSDVIIMSFNRNYIRKNGREYYIMTRYIDNWIIQLVDSLPKDYIKKLKLSSDTIKIDARLKY